jgi:hypothetical protein
LNENYKFTDPSSMNSHTSKKITIILKATREKQTSYTSKNDFRHLTRNNGDQGMMEQGLQSS